MSKIALEGNASGTGTFTVAAPNSNSNYTLTLPQSTGTVVVTGGAQTIEFAAGTASTPSITFTGDTNTGIFSPAADTIAFTEGGAESMRIDSSGNLGLGETNPTARLDVKASRAISRLTSSTGTNAVDFQANNTGGQLLIGIDSSTGGSLFGAGGYTAGLWHTGAYPLVFGTNNTERARITSGGALLVGATTLAGSGAFQADHPTGGQNIATFRNTAASDPYGNATNFTGATPDNTTNYFEIYTDSTNTKAVLYSNGSWQVRANSYGGISDVKLKQDIVDANSQWDDIKGLRIRKYRFKDEVAADPDYPSHLGVIAQEAEIVSPGLVFESPDFENVIRTREVEKTRVVTEAVLDEDGNEIEPAVTETYTEEEEYTERVATGTVTKGVKYSILYMKAVKALQEAMVRIETLETKVAALENK